MSVSTIGIKKGALIMIMVIIMLQQCDANKAAFCRKYVFAPVCRGVAAKRDIQQLVPLIEESALQGTQDGASLRKNFLQKRPDYIDEERATYLNDKKYPQRHH